MAIFGACRKQLLFFFVVVSIVFFRPAISHAVESFDFFGSKSPIVLEVGFKNSFHYNFERESIMTPPRIIFVGAQVGYLMDGWLMAYAEFNASVSQVTARAIFLGLKFKVLSKRLSNSSTAFFKSIMLTLNADYGLISLANPVPPDVYIPNEFLPRLGGGVSVFFGKGKSFMDFNGYAYNQSNSNLMFSIGMNFGFLVY